jgi:hypothetical protein
MRRSHLLTLLALVLFFTITANYLMLINLSHEEKKHIMQQENLSSSLPRVVISGVAKNIASSHIRIHVPKLIKLGESFQKYHIVIYENDSPPDTRNAYKEELAKTEHSTYLFEDGVSTGSRVQNIARARNKVLDYVHNNLADSFDYLIITDLDAVCGGHNMQLSYDSELFNYVLSQSSMWDMISFRFIPYWDLWAFRDHDHMPYNMYGPQSSSNLFKTSANFDMWLSKFSPTDLIPVESAFMMLAIYKIEKTINCTYSSIGIDKEDDCEHVAFHRDMINKHNARIRLMPLIYCQGDDGYQPLSQLNVTN